MPIQTLPVGLQRYGAPLLSLVLLAGVWADWQSFHLPAGDTAGYHAAVRLIADQLPERIGDWSATVVDPPPAAVALLKPNLLRGREFRNVVTGERATLAIVQCRDARDMGGHWPPVCYPAQGWTLRETARRTIQVDDRSIPITVYRFTIEAIDRYSELVVYNFFLRPDGIVDAGRDGVLEAAEDPRMKTFGAAQVQVSFDRSVGADRRDEIFRTLVAGTRPLIDAVLGGARR